MDDRHGPHLTSQESQTLHHGIGESAEGDLVRSTRVVGCIWLLHDPLVPVVSVSVQCTDAMAIDPDIVTPEDERRRLILVANRKRRVQPVLDVSAPLLGQTPRNNGSQFDSQVALPVRRCQRLRGR